AAEPAGDGRPDPYEKGLGLRREVLGDAQVDRALAEDPDGTLQGLVHRYEWGEVWSREGLDRRTRSAVTLTALLAGGHREALADHTRAALRNGLSPDEIREIVLHAGVYCGLPAAETALRVVTRVIAEETTPPA
ncbi:3-oxoadipate enol-lactonase, partial [Streptomyces sp. SID5770]|uniref:carboxymuconolactone decarboxylase family protein n=2 Tax=unclassified Streptomyces TaxID=2593676 RepID=UPI00138599DE